MGLFNFFRKAQESEIKPTVKRKRSTQAKRSFLGAEISRLTDDWTTQTTSADSEIYSVLSVLRARSRDLAVNNEYGRRFLKLAMINVIGPNGIRLQAKAKNERGEFDTSDNQVLEDNFKRWCRKENASVDGKSSFLDIQNLIVISLMRDGEIFVRKVKGYDNPFRYSLQLIEADFIDDRYNDVLQNGNVVRMGIESNSWGKPVAYHALTRHPGDRIRSSASSDRQRIPANEILHIYSPERCGQSRGIPALVAGMYGLKQLKGFIDAEVVAARISAQKLGFFTSPEGDGYQGDDEENGAPIMTGEPGTWEQLPSGMSVETFDVSHPNVNFSEFQKGILRGVASGFGVSYTSLGNDLEGVNFSSARVGMLEERETWKVLQQFMIEHFLTPIYEDWLTMFLALPSTRLPPRKLDKFLKVEWQKRGWGWVDPLKEVRANVEAINSGIKSRQDVASEQGKDVEELFEQIDLEQKILNSGTIKIKGFNDEKTVMKNEK
jgi:lambda family phage portal protein